MRNYLHPFTLLLPLLVALLTFLPNASAQQYDLITDTLDIYCVQFPDGTYLPARYERKDKNIALSDFNIEEARIKALINQNKKRIRRLGGIVRKYSPNTRNKKGLISFSRIFRAVKEKRYRKGARRLKAQARKLASFLRRQNRELFDALSLLKSCENEEPLSVSGGNVAIEEFEFIHPDFGVTYYMRGIAVRTQLPKRQSEAVACVSATNGSFTPAETFPSEARLRFTNNPCEYFSGRITRNPIFCPNILGNRVGSLWLEWGVSARSIYSKSSSLSLRQLESNLRNLGSVIVRSVKRKEDCR